MEHVDAVLASQRVDFGFGAGTVLQTDEPYVLDAQKRQHRFELDRSLQAARSGRSAFPRNAYMQSTWPLAQRVTPVGNAFRIGLQIPAVQREVLQVGS